jgi:hypothetical protein
MSSAYALHDVQKFHPQKKRAQPVSQLSPDEVEGVQIAWSPSGREPWIWETIYIVLYRFDIHRLNCSTGQGVGLIAEPVETD